MSEWIFVEISVVLLITVFVYKVYRYRMWVYLEKTKEALERQRYENDLAMLELLFGKSLPEDKREYLLTPEGHELVTWVLEHQEKR